MKEKMKKILNKETILYIIFGVITTIVDFVAFAIFHYVFEMNEIFANTLAWFIAVIVAYITNKIYVFEKKSFDLNSLLHEIPSFFMARVASLVVTDIFLVIAGIVNMNMLFAKAVISVVVIIMNYFFSKLFVFKNNDNQENDMKDNKKRMLEKLKNNIALIMAFLIPSIIITCIFIGSEVVPFGDNIYLRSDCYHQYAPYMRELYRKITEGGSFLFSWNIGMGVNFTPILAYYLASPINILLGILAPNGNVLITIDLYIIVKTGLCGFTLAYYLSKRHNTRNLTIALAGMFYALSSYMAAFSWNIMWLDCLWLFPIVVLGIEKLVKEKKYLTYVIALGISIFSNYYIAIMVCIFSVFYFAVMLFTNSCEKTIKYYINRIWLFAKYSLIAGGIGAAMFMPAMYALSYTASGEMNFPEEWTSYFSVLEMMSRSLMSVPVSIFNAHEPNVYCTVAVFLLVPLYCLCDKINGKEKIGKLMLVALMLISFNLNVPNYIWHGLHFPNSLPARESFIYIFLVITMGYEAVIHLRSFTTKQIGGCFAGALALFLVIEENYVSGEEYPFQIVYVSALFLMFYYLLALAYNKKQIHKNVIIYLLCIVCIAEATINSTHEDAYNVTGYSYYFKDNEAIDDLLAQIPDKDLYRVEKINRKTKNDAAWNDYHGVSIFSSTASSYFTDYLGYLGFEKSTNAYSHYGYTPFTSALLSVRYVIGNTANLEDKNDFTLIASREDESRYLYKVNTTLPFGFMLPSDFDENWNMSGNNPFAVQNSFAQEATGIEGMYTQLRADCVGRTTYIYVEEDCDLYIFCTTYVEKIEYTADDEESGFHLSGSASGLKHRQVVHIGEVPAGTIVDVSTDDDVSTLQLYAYALNEDVMDKVISEMSDEGLKMTEYNDTYIKGNITVKEAGVMYTSIIYDKGWHAYVDGKEVETESIKGAMLAIPLEAGTHEIELKYSPEGSNSGLLITIFSIAVLVACVVYDRKKKTFMKRFSKKDEEIEAIETALASNVNEIEGDESK